MKVIYTDQSHESLDESVEFLLYEQKLPLEKVSEIVDRVLNKADNLATTYRIYPLEQSLDHLGLGHRRAIEGHFKIVFLIEGAVIYITDIFDTRQDPRKIKS
ncbi:MAG: hypothetical protein AAFO69_11945 [Bacteroidota bacterium]